MAVLLDVSGGGGRHCFATDSTGPCFPTRRDYALSVTPGLGVAV